MERKLNDNWLLISGNNSNINYHETNIAAEDGIKVQLPCYTHMYIEDHVGISWYQKDFMIDKLPDADQIALLCFEQADFRAEVSVNNKILGVHTGCEDSFCFDISDVLHIGSNMVTVRISKPHHDVVDGYSFVEILLSIDRLPESIVYLLLRPPKETFVILEYLPPCGRGICK